MDELQTSISDYGFKNPVNKSDAIGRIRYIKQKNGEFKKTNTGAVYEDEDDNYKVKFDKSKMKTAKDRNEVYGSVASTLIASQVATGKKAVEAMLKAGYDAIPDVNGTDVAYDPIIVLDPDKKLTKTSVTKMNPPSQTSWPMMNPRYSDLELQDKKKWWPFNR